VPQAALASPALTFSKADLQILEVLKQSPDGAGWSFSLDHGEAWDLICVQPPFAEVGIFSVIPSTTGQGVLLTTEGAEEIAFPSLSAALLSIGPRGADWRRCIG
jgi:hypothetical protein